MQDSKNMAMDRYEFDKEILIALNSEDMEKARKIIKEDMKIIEDDYEEEFTIQPDCDTKKEISIKTASDNR